MVTFNGQSTSFILLGLRENQYGELISIDLPATESVPWSTDGMRESNLPLGRQPGWLIPEALRQRHRLLLGDARDLLPRVCGDCSQIELFIHDSLHTYDHMYFEFETAWTSISHGGLLMSDDIMANAAFHKFCQRVRRNYVVVDDFGAARK